MTSVISTRGSHEENMKRVLVRKPTKRYTGKVMRLLRPASVSARLRFPPAPEEPKWSLRLPPLSVREVTKPGNQKNSVFWDFEGWGVDDVYVLRMCNAGAKQSYDSCRSVNFQNNRLEGPCLPTLAERLSSELLSLNLASNRLTSLDALHTKKFVNLRELNLSSNPLGDGVVGLFQALSSSYPNLRGLGLGNCNLGSETSARAVAQYVRQAQKLKYLDLQWGHFSSFTGYFVAGGLYENTTMLPSPGSSLRRVHLGHNSLGSGQVVPQEQKNSKALQRCLWEGLRCAKMLASLFAENKTLFHFDLSYNNFSPAECQAISEGLRDNKTLFGLHFIGNAGVIDPEGFMKQKTAKTIFNPEPTRMLQLLVPLQFHPGYTYKPACCIPEEDQMGWLDQRMQVSLPQCFNTHDCTYDLDCWVCNNWIPYPISFRPHADAEIPAGEEVIALLSIDNYDSPLILTPDSRALQTWKGLRMVPPSMGPVVVFFKHKDQFYLSEQMQTMPTSGLDLPPTFAQSLTKVNFFRADMKCWELFVKKKMGQLNFCDGAPSHTKVYPRTARDIGGTREKSSVWTIEQSIFKDYQMDSQTAFVQCLQADWNGTTLPRVVQDSVHLQETLKTHYEHLVNIFRWTSASCTTPVLTMTSKAFSKFCQQCDPQFFDHNFTLSQVELTFAQANAAVDDEKRTEYKLMSNKGLVRFQFLEAFVRLGIAKFHNYSTLDGMKKMIDIVLRNGTKLTEERRKFLDMLFTEECNFALAEDEARLRAVYNKYQVFMPTQQSSSMLSFYGWTEFLNDVAAYDNKFTSKDAAIPFAFYAKELAVNEPNHYRSMELSFSEFLVAIAAIVHMREGFNEATFSDQLEEFIEVEIRALCDDMAEGTHRKSGKLEMDLDTRKCCAFLRRAFEEADQDNTGTLDIDEFNQRFAGDQAKQEMKEFGIKYGDIRLLFKEIDSRKSSRITSDEMIKAFIRMRRKCAGKDRVIALLEENFYQADEKQRGAIPRHVFNTFFNKRQIIAKLGAVGLDADDMAEIAQILDAGGSNTVSVDDLLTAFLSIRDPSQTTQSALAFLKQTAGEMDADGKKMFSLVELHCLLSNPTVVKKMKRLKVSAPTALECFAVFGAEQDGELSWTQIFGYMEGKINPKKVDSDGTSSSWGPVSKTLKFLKKAR